MGNSQRNPDDFNKDDWIEVAKTSNLVTLWENKVNRNIHIEQHKIYTLDHSELDSERDLYYKRKNHQRWVAAYYFKQQSSEEFCVSKSEAHIFIEKIPIRINDLRDLPIPDAIHAYDQCLQGYLQLAKLYGCFKVHPEFIGVNQKGVVKVWAGQKWSQIGVISGKVNQQQMVRSIIDSIQGSVDMIAMQRAGPPIVNYLYRQTDKLTFDRAIFELKGYSRLVNFGQIPSRLESLHQTSESELFMQPLLLSQQEYYRHQYNPSNFTSTSQEVVNSTFRKVENPHYVQTVQSYASRTFSSQPRDIVANSIRGYPFENQNAYSRTKVNNYPMAPAQSQKLTSQYNPAYPHFHSQAQTPPISHINHPSNYTFSNQLSQLRPQQAYPATQISSQHIRNDSNIAPKSVETPTITFSTHQKRQIQPSQPLPPIYSNFSHYNQTHVQSSPQFKQISFQAAQTVAQPRKQAQNGIVKPNKPIPESIIMQLYRSEDRFGGSDSPQLPLKQFGRVKKAQSILQQPKKFESVTIINQNYGNPLLGLPNYYQTTTPASSNLHSIQQLSAENTPARTFLGSSNPANLNSNFSSLAKDVNYASIDPNDGKSSSELLSYLKSIGPV